MYIPNVCYYISVCALNLRSNIGRIKYKLLHFNFNFNVVTDTHVLYFGKYDDEY